MPVYLDTGGNNVDSIEASLAYPASQLTCVGIRAGGSFALYGGSGTNTCSGGTAHFVAARTSNYTASENVAIMTFRGDVAGSASVTITSADVQSVGNPVATATSGGTVTVNALPSAQPPPTSNTGGSSTAANTGPQPSTGNKPPVQNSGSSPPQASSQPITSSAADTAPPQISDAKSEVTEKSVAITWKTNEPATSEIEYGLSQSYGFNAASEGLSTDHRVVLDSKLVQKGSLYNFRVKSTDSSGNTAFSGGQTFKLRDSEAQASDSKTQLLLLASLALFAVSGMAVGFLRRSRIRQMHFRFGQQLDKTSASTASPHDSSNIVIKPTNAILPAPTPVIDKNMTLEEIEKKFSNRK